MPGATDLSDQELLTIIASGAPKSPAASLSDAELMKIVKGAAPAIAPVRPPIAQPSAPPEPEINLTRPLLKLIQPPSPLGPALDVTGELYGQAREIALAHPALAGAREKLSEEPFKPPSALLQLASGQSPAVAAGTQLIGQLSPRVVAKQAQGLAIDVATGAGIDVGVPAISRFLSAKPNLMKLVDKEFFQAVRPSFAGKATVGALEKYKHNAAAAIGQIVQNKPRLGLTDDAGQVVEKLPESVADFAQAIQATKNQIFDQYNAVAQQAGELGVKVKTAPIARELNAVIHNKIIRLKNPEAVNYAKAWQARLTKAKELNSGDAQDLIEAFNRDLQNFYKNPSYEAGTKVAIDAGLARAFRGALDALIEKATGTPYQPLKALYGALKAIEGDVQRRLIVSQRAAPKGFFDIADVFARGDMVHGLLRLDPSLMAAGAAKEGLVRYFKFLNNPNTIVKNLFQKAEKALQGQGPSSATGQLLRAVPKAVQDLGQNIRTRQAQTRPQVELTYEKLPGLAAAGATGKAIGESKPKQGIASTYGWGEKLNKHTKNGEIFDPQAMTAASYEFPMGSIVRVTDLKTNKYVDVRINDVGPNKRLGRIIDLTQGAWKKLGIEKPGLAKVSVERIK